MDISPNSETLRRVYEKLECPNIVSLIQHTAFVTATQDAPAPQQIQAEDTNEWRRACFKLNRLADDLIAFAQLLDRGVDAEMRVRLGRFDEMCADFLPLLDRYFPIARA